MAAAERDDTTSRRFRGDSQGTDRRLRCRAVALVPGGGQG